MSNAMELSKETLEQIGGYVRQNLGTWIRDINPPLTALGTAMTFAIVNAG